MESQSGAKWEVAADLKGCRRFFPIPTTKKPDLVIWNEEEKEVHLVELTVPHEDISIMHMSRQIIAMRLLLKNVRRRGGKQSISQSKLVAEDSLRLASQSRWEWQDLDQRKEIPSQKLFRRLEKASHWIWLKREDTSWSESWWLTAKAIQLNWQRNLTLVRGLGAS